MRDMKRNMRARWHMNHKTTRILPVGMHRLCVPPFLARVLDFAQLHVLNRGHWNGLSSCRLGRHLKRNIPTSEYIWKTESDGPLPPPPNVAYS